MSIKFSPTVQLQLQLLPWLIPSFLVIDSPLDIWEAIDLLFPAPAFATSNNENVNEPLICCVSNWKEIRINPEITLEEPWIISLPILSLFLRISEDWSTRINYILSNSSIGEVLMGQHFWELLYVRAMNYWIVNLLELINSDRNYFNFDKLTSIFLCPCFLFDPLRDAVGRIDINGLNVSTGDDCFAK